MQYIGKNLLLTLGILSTASVAHAATLTVGPGQAFTTISSAVAAAQDGDVVHVFAGVYVNDFPEITSKITLAGIGGAVRLLATEYIPNRKAILITDTDATVQGLTFNGAKVSDDDGGNGAGIRYQGGNLVIKGCMFINNQEGILAAPDPNGTITIINSEFTHNGVASGPSSGYTHNLYVNEVHQLTIQNSYIHNALVGHEIKSRADITTIDGSRIAERPAGTASYSIDLPNGGVASITNNMIEQGPNSGNPSIIAYGEEGNVYGTSSLTVSGNLFDNDLNSSSSRGVWNASSVTADVSNNQTFGLTSDEFVNGPANVSGTQIMLNEPAIPATHPWSK